MAKNNGGFFKLSYDFIRYKWDLGLSRTEILILEELMTTTRKNFVYCQSTLADTMSLTRKCVNQALNKMQEMGLIKVTRVKNEINRYEYSGLFQKIQNLKNGITVPIKQEKIKRPRKVGNPKYDNLKDSEEAMADDKGNGPVCYNTKDELKKVKPQKEEVSELNTEINTTTNTLEDIEKISLV